MKKLLLFLIFPYVSYSQNIDKEEAYRIYKCCLSYYQNDTSKNTFIKESTVYYKISDTPNKLNLRFYKTNWQNFKWDTSIWPGTFGVKFNS